MNRPSRFTHPANESPASVYPYAAGHSIAAAMKQLGGISVRVKEAMSTRTMGGATVELLLQVCKEAATLDEHMQTWPSTVLRSWEYQTLATPAIVALKACRPSPLYIHVFQSELDAMTWVGYWNIRLSAQIVILRCLPAIARADVPLPAAFRKDVVYTRMREYVNNICACVPALLGEIDERGAVQHSRLPRAAGAYTLMWPLNSICGLREADEIEPGLRDWGLGRLQYIGDNFGMRQAYLFRAGHLDGLESEKLRQ